MTATWLLFWISTARALSTQNICTNMSNIGHLVKERMFTGNVLLRKPCHGLLMCAYECKHTPLCAAFKYDVAGGICVLHAPLPGGMSPIRVSGILEEWFPNKFTQALQASPQVKQTAPPGDTFSNCTYRLKFYKGNVTTTNTGNDCQRWDEIFPHDHEHGDGCFKYIGETAREAANYCRTPDCDSEFKPWCYTTNVAFRWEFCDVDIPC